MYFADSMLDLTPDPTQGFGS